MKKYHDGGIISAGTLVPRIVGECDFAERMYARTLRRFPKTVARLHESEKKDDTQ